MSRTFADLLTRHVHEQQKRPCDFEAALSAIRFIETTLIRESQGRYLESQDELEIIRRFVYDRAQPAELHRAARTTTDEPDRG